VVIIPIYKNQEQLDQISEYAKKLKAGLEANQISVKYDNRDTHKPGYKFADYELKGVPVRIALGPRDMENQTAEIARRDTLEKMSINQADIVARVITLLSDIQENIYNKALKFQLENTTKVDSWEEFQQLLDEKGGFLAAHWDGTKETEEKIKDATKATIRCIPLNAEDEEGKCIFTGNPSHKRVLFARAY
jgi:prolyl-tRNA synthetase